jgi:hypothetical protein
MNGARAQKRIGTASPRWGWSGAAKLTEPWEHAPRLPNVVNLLPTHRSEIQEITSRLLDLGIRYHRYVKQDELGPSRAERMAGLRVAAERLDHVKLKLVQSSGNLREYFCNHFEPVEIANAPSAFDFYQACLGALDCLGEAADDVGRAAANRGAKAQAKLMSELSSAIESARAHILSLDSTTEGEVVLDTANSHPEILRHETKSNEIFLMHCDQLEQLRKWLQKALALLEGQKGPEAQKSLPWLVWQLCDVWFDETGLPVTSNSVEKSSYTGRPKSAAGQFVVAAFEALCFPKSLSDHQHNSDLPTRARLVLGEAASRERPIYYAMREYVANHSEQSAVRRGRRKTAKVTL